MAKVFLDCATREKEQLPPMCGSFHFDWGLNDEFSVKF